MNGWAIPMLLTGGLFAGGVGYFAWERIPAWRAMDTAQFRSDFARSIRRADRLQPALLIVCLGSTVGFAFGSGGAARALSLTAAGGLLVTLVGSGAALVPLQRRLIAGGAGGVERLQRRWCQGHLARTAVALASFVLVVVAATT